MSKPEISEPVETLAQQKERLILQCQAYRSGIGQSRNLVRAHLGREGITRAAFGILGSRAQNALANVTDLVNMSGGISLAKIQRLAPFVLSGISILSKRSVLKPILRGAALVGAVGAGLYLFARNRKIPPQIEE